MDYLTASALVLTGIVIGAALTILFRKKQTQDEELAKRLDELNTDFADYQTEVQQHFSKSADLFNQLTKDYANVHQHLATGAQSLAQTKNGNLLSDETGFLPLSENTENVELEGDSTVSSIIEKIQSSDSSDSDISGTVTETKNETAEKISSTASANSKNNSLNTENG